MSPEIAEGLLAWIILCISIALHEYGHARAADRLGDPTPRLQGRVTLNPLAHLDVIGTGVIPLLNIMIPIFTGVSIPVMFGWGKPVMINPLNIEPKKRVRFDLLATAAGPAMNVVLIAVGALLLGVAVPFAPMLGTLVIQLLLINASLVVFNLMPLPPLDGSHFLKHALKLSDEFMMRMSFYSLFIMLFLINFAPFRALMHTLILGLLTPFLWVSDLLQRLVA